MDTENHLQALLGDYLDRSAIEEFMVQFLQWLTERQGVYLAKAQQVETDYPYPHAESPYTTKECMECGWIEEIAEDDYICPVCRTNRELRERGCDEDGYPIHWAPHSKYVSGEMWQREMAYTLQPNTDDLQVLNASLSSLVMEFIEAHRHQGRGTLFAYGANGHLKPVPF